jgi:hypothetical protein
MSEADVRLLIHEAEANGVTLWMEGGQLRFKTRNGKLTSVLRAALQSRKADLIGELSIPIFRKRVSPPAVVRCAADRIGFWKECESDIALRHGTHYAVRLTGPVELERIDAAFKRLIARHDLLRSRVRIADDGVPFLHLTEDPPVSVSIVDLSGSGGASSPLPVKTAVEGAIYAPFEDGQIYRTQIIKVSDSEYVLAGVIHHFVADAFSVKVVFRDLKSGLLGGEDTQIQTRERPLQYADYLFGMSEWLDGPGLVCRLAHWKDKMRGAQGVHFPLADESQRTGPSKLGVLNIHVGMELRAKLARVVAITGMPFSIAILAANFAALARTFQRRDFFTVLLYSGRDDTALFDMVGSTIGSIPVRVTIDSKMSFAELLIHVQDAFVFAVAHRVPWGILKPILGEIGAGHAAPFFNYLSVARDAASTPPSSTHGKSLQIEPVAVRRPEQTDIVDWKSYEVHAVDTGVEVYVNLRYMPSVYRPTAIQAFADTLLYCLEALADDPRRSAGS